MRIIALALALLASPAFAGGKGIVTVYGSSSCPGGFRPIYRGVVVYLNADRIGTVADGLCWRSVPAAPAQENPILAPNAFTVIGDCVVCR